MSTICDETKSWRNFITPHSSISLWHFITALIPFMLHHHTMPNIMIQNAETNYCSQTLWWHFPSIWYKTTLCQTHMKLIHQHMIPMITPQNTQPNCFRRLPSPPSPSSPSSPSAPPPSSPHPHKSSLTAQNYQHSPAPPPPTPAPQPPPASTPQNSYKPQAAPPTPSPSPPPASPESPHTPPATSPLFPKHPPNTSNDHSRAPPHTPPASSQKTTAPHPLSQHDCKPSKPRETQRRQAARRRPPSAGKSPAQSRPGRGKRRSK